VAGLCARHLRRHGRRAHPGLRQAAQRHRRRGYHGLRDAHRALPRRLQVRHHRRLRGRHHLRYCLPPWLLAVAAGPEQVRRVLLGAAGRHPGARVVRRRLHGADEHWAALHVALPAAG
ncbi:hypothetical protein BN1723_019497, partial [Verticillium longisporum]